MAPALEDGDYAVAKRLGPGEDLAIGDIVELEHPEFGPMVKRVSRVGPGGLGVSGLSGLSLEAEQIGPVARARIRARLVWRISPKGLSRIPAGAGSG